LNLKEEKMQSAERIDFVGHNAKNSNNRGGASSILTVDLRIFKKGPSHVVGLTYTTDFWKTRNEQLASFQNFDGDFEVWQAKVNAPGNNVSFEYVIFCDDYRDIQNVKKIYNTNNGETFRILTTN
jgi:hypothetical protein